MFRCKARDFMRNEAYFVVRRLSAPQQMAFWDRHLSSFLCYCGIGTHPRAGTALRAGISNFIIPVKLND